jgi:hypothetical protein
MENESKSSIKYSNNKGVGFILRIVRYLLGKMTDVDKTDPVDDWAKSVDKLPKPPVKPPVKKEDK